MRIVAIVVLLVACTATPPVPSNAEPSVRARLAASVPTRFVVGADPAGGVATARRWTGDGWREGDTPLAIDGAELELAVAGDDDRTLVVSGVDIRLAPIAIPDDVFGQPAAMTGVELALDERAVGDIAWSDDDRGTARVPVVLEWQWSISIAGGTTPLAIVRLPPIDADVVVAGDRDHVDAHVELRAMGALWSWAGILEVTALRLAFDATTSS